MATKEIGGDKLEIVEAKNENLEHLIFKEQIGNGSINNYTDGNKKIQTYYEMFSFKKFIPVLPRMCHVRFHTVRAQFQNMRECHAAHIFRKSVPCKRRTMILQ